jgi:DNA polymerase-1
MDQQRKYKFIQQQNELDGVLPELMSKPMWGIDVETNGKDPHLNQTILMQIGRGLEGFVIDTRKVNVSQLNPFFESKTIKKVAHNAAFEVKMIRGNSKARCNTMRCTMLAEQLLNNGLPYEEVSLEAVTLRRLKVQRDKSFQKSFLGHQGDFSEGQLLYAEQDIWYLDAIIKQQSNEMARLGLGQVFVLECNALPVFADMEYDGLPFDSERWRYLRYDNNKKLKEIQKILDGYAGKYFTPDLETGLDINYNSPAQVLQLLNRIGIVDQNGKPATFTGTSEKHLQNFKNHPFVNALDNWRSLNKAISTYSDSYINAIHPVTERIHPELWQIGTDTGRPSSRGAVNVLTIPKDVRYRKCFAVPDGHLMQTDDYSGCEPRILAHTSQDPFLIKTFKEDRDIHCEVASFLFNIPVAKNEKYASRFNVDYIPENTKYRVPGKRLNLGITYGQGLLSLFADINAEGFSITQEETKTLLYKYRQKLKKACDYIKQSGYIALDDEVLQNINGRIRHFQVPKPSNFQLGKEDPQYKKQIGGIMRSAGNFPIQSVCSDILKICMAELRGFCLDNKIEMSIVNVIYDEIVTMTKEEDSDFFHTHKKRIMTEVAQRIITTVPMPVESCVGKYWGG